jgi:hypothetical protein
MNRPTDLTASERVTEFMREDNEKDRQVLQHIPHERRVRSLTALDFVDSDEDPRPMQIHVYSAKLEYAYRLG